MVPYTRGPECSRSFSNIIQEAKQLVENGSREITLLGQNVNAYKFGKKKLSDLIYSLNEIKELDRIRYTSSHPNDVTPDLITSHKDCKKLMPLLHLPVQSGSNNILEKMGRKHTVEQYIEITQKLKKVRPEIKFSSDFIISFPDETEKDFNDSINLLQNIKFINTYSFIYSSRPGTPASKLSEISRFISKKRLIKFQEEASKIKKNYKKSLMGTFTRVLFENKVDDQNYFGRDEFFNSVIVKSKKDIIGKVKNVRLEQCNQNTLFGELVQNNQKENVAA